MTIKSTGYYYKISRCPATGKIKTTRVKSDRHTKGQIFDGLLDPKLHK